MNCSGTPLEQNSSQKFSLMERSRNLFSNQKSSGIPLELGRSSWGEGGGGCRQRDRQRERGLSFLLDASEKMKAGRQVPGLLVLLLQELSRILPEGTGSSGNLQKRISLFLKSSGMFLILTKYKYLDYNV